MLEISSEITEEDDVTTEDCLLLAGVKKTGSGNLIPGVGTEASLCGLGSGTGTRLI